MRALSTCGENAQRYLKDHGFKTIAKTMTNVDVLYLLDSEGTPTDDRVQVSFYGDITFLVTDDMGTSAEEWPSIQSLVAFL